MCAMRWKRLKITALRDGRVTKYKVPGYLSHPVEGSHSPPPRHGLLCLCFNLFSGLSVMAVRSALTTINHFLILKKMHRQVGYKGQRKCQRFGKIMARNGRRCYLGTGARTISWLQLENINLYVLPVGMSVHFPSIIHKPRCRRAKGRLISSHRLFPHLLRLKMILTMSWIPRSQIKRNIVLGGYTVLCIQCLSKFSIMGGNCWTKG